MKGVRCVLWRSHDGKVCHRWDCHHRTKRYVPWWWAEGKTAEAIGAVPWVHFCKVCKPLEAVA